MMSKRFLDFRRAQIVRREGSVASCMTDETDNLSRIKTKSDRNMLHGTYYRK